MKREKDVEAFYKTKAWQRCRDQYVKSVGGICERCYENGTITPGEIVHHREHVNLKTVRDPAITLSSDNLILLCRKCHAAEHPEMYGHEDRRYEVINGRVVIKNITE